MAGEYPYVYVWRNNPVRRALSGRRCALIGKAKKGTILVEFENGERVATSINAIRRNKSGSGKK
jgi:hypothetical protein